MSHAYEPSPREAWWVQVAVPVVALLWLFELGAPVSLLLSEHRGTVGTAFGLAATAVFVLAYVWVAVDNIRTRPQRWATDRAGDMRVWVRVR